MNISTIKNDLPNFSNEIIEEWILPYATKIGWPPKHPRWDDILCNKNLYFWRNVQWEKKQVDLNKINFDYFTNNGIMEMIQAYFQNINNAFSSIDDGRDRCLNSLFYFLQYGRFPKPIYLLRNQNDYSIVDGNHRMVSFQMFQFIANIYNKSGKNDEKIVSFTETLQKKGITKIAEFSPLHDVWIGK